MTSLIGDMNKARRLVPLLAALSLSAGVIILVVGALWMIGSATGERDRFSSLKIAPADAVFYMAINTEPSSPQWLAVSDILETLNAKEPIRDAIDEELLQFGLQFERDILPLAGDEGYVAITDIDALVDETGGFVVAFRVRDSGKAEEIVLNVAEQEGTEFEEEEYLGETIRYAETVTGGGLEDDGAISFVDNVMVLGTSPEDVKGVIDVIDGQAPNAETNERLREMRERQTEDFLVWGYADLTQLWDFLETYLAENAPPDLEESLGGEQVLEEARKNYDRITFALSSQRDGFVLDYSYLVPAESSDKLGLGVPFKSQYAERVPADTMLFFSGNDLYNEGYVPGRDDLFEATGDLFQESGQESQTWSDILSDLEREIGIDLEDDLLSLLTGEIAVAANASDLSSEEPDIEILALAEVNDGDKMENTMQKLGEFLERENIATVENSSREGFHRWSPVDAPESAAWTVTDREVILGYPERAVEAFVDGQDESLADTADWKRTMEILPDDGTSLGYVSVARLIEEARKMEGVEADFAESTDRKVTFEDLAPIRAFGMATTTMEDGYSARLVVLITD